MNFETITFRIQSALLNLFREVEVNKINVDHSLLKHWAVPEFSDHDLKGLEFFCDNTERFVMFYIVHKETGEVKFNRPKAGILEELIPNTKFSDFHFDLTDKPTTPNDVMGKFLTVAINNRVGEDFHRMMEDKMDEFGLLPDSMKYSLAWKVIKSDRIRMTYMAKFELNVKPKGMERECYVGHYMDGQIMSLCVKATCAPVDFDTLFKE